MSAEMKSVYSSHINEIGYDHGNQELVVEYQTGKIYVAKGVKPDEAAAVMNAASVGRALNELKQKYKLEPLGD